MQAKLAITGGQSEKTSTWGGRGRPSLKGGEEHSLKRGGTGINISTLFTVSGRFEKTWVEGMRRRLTPGPKGEWKEGSGEGKWFGVSLIPAQINEEYQCEKKKKEKKKKKKKKKHSRQLVSYGAGTSRYSGRHAP